MANSRSTLCIAAILCIAFVNGRMQSNRWITTSSSLYLYPIDVCITKQFQIGRFHSHKFICEPQECCQENKNGVVECFEDCNRIVRKFIYKDENCSGNAYFVDQFEHSHAGDYPFNCYEAEEAEAMNPATGISTAANPNDYAPSYMIVKLSRGMVQNVITNVNGTNTTKKVCGKHPNATFYESFAAVTNTCYSRQMPYDNRPYWYLAKCDNNTIYVGKFNSSTCNKSSEINDGRFPLLKDNECKLTQKWQGDYWYSEVAECSHVTAGLDATGVRNIDNQWISVIFGIVVVIVNY